MASISTFLPNGKQALDTSKSHGTKPRDVLLYGGRTAPQKLNITIVGCGIAGLATAFCLGQAGHNVTVLESAPALGEVGAGIQVGPNMSRLFIRWGLSERLKELAVRPSSFALLRYDNGERVGLSLFGDKMERDHGSPYYHVHRADLISMLYDLARPWMNLRLGCKVASIDPSAPSVTLESGEVVSADLIIGADGVKSVVRGSLVEGPDQPLPTGDAAYRATVPTSEMMKDPELRPFVETAEALCWMGPGKHIVGYCIRGKKEYNMVMLHPDTGSVESWTDAASVDEMRAAYEGWEPRVRKLQALAKSTMKSRLMVRLPLKTWVHSSGRVALLGDSCHSMLPYRAQGAAMAVEDAAVIGNLFSRITNKSQIASLLLAYEELRYARATATQQASWSNQKIFHLPDGPEQQARDANMRAAMEVTLKEARGEPCDPNANSGNANILADQGKNIEQFSYDADEVVNTWWGRNGSVFSEGIQAQAKL